MKKTFLKNEEAKILLEPLMENGKFVYIPQSDLTKIQKYGKDNLSMLDETHKRLYNPHIYGVGLSLELYRLQQNLIEKYSRS